MSCRLQLYAFEHVPARYIGIMAAGDAKLEVAEAGKAALRPPKPSAAGACAAGILTENEQSLSCSQHRVLQAVSGLRARCQHLDLHLLDPQ